MAGLIGVLESKALEIIARSAPLVASAFGSPVAGIVVSLLSNAFGVHQDGLNTAITTDPDAATKLKALELQHQEELAKIANMTVQLDNQESSDARDYETKIRDRMPMILGLIITALYIVTLFIALYHPDDQAISVRVEHIMLIVVGYYFGRQHSRIVS